MVYATFEAEKNRKAFLYTAIICALLLLLFFFIQWHPNTVPAVIPQDLIEINLGNDQDGFGETQPLIKGSRAVAQEEVVRPQEAAAKNNEAASQPDPDDNADKDAAPLTRTEKLTKPTDEKPAARKTKPADQQKIIAPKPKKPVLTYNGPARSGGNDATEDNGFRSQGDKPGGKGDAGSSDGNPDSYGNSLNGKIGNGPRVISGDRRIVRTYSFTGDLDKATIFALVKVSENGVGTFVDFGRNSSSRSSAYANAIREYLRNMKFNTSDHESDVTVQFNFSVR